MTDPNTGETNAARFHGVSIDEEERATDKSTELAIYDVLRREGPTTQGKLIELVQTKLKRSDCKSGDKYLITVLDSMVKNAKLKRTEGGKRNSKIYEIKD